MADVTEIAQDVFRISIFVPAINLGFNHFLVRDDEPLLFHTGYKRMFPEIRDAVAKIVDPASVRHIGFSHFEGDECGGLNEWLAQAPRAEAVAGLVGGLINLQDFAIRPPRVVAREDVVETGRYRFRFIPTPQLPHGWDAGMLFEETGRTLFCSDLFHQSGDVEPLTGSPVLDRVREAMTGMESGPLAGYVPYTRHTARMLAELAALRPATLAIMHGSSFQGAGDAALAGLSELMKSVLQGPPGEGTLYARLGGYDAIAAIIDDLLASLRSDPAFARFAAGRGIDSQNRARQLLVDQICALAGGPCFYIGRDMKTTHAGLRISEAEWQANLRYTSDALRKRGVAPKEEAEFLDLFERYRQDIVEAVHRGA
jgi:truncated hemoglobin YjbI